MIAVQTSLSTGQIRNTRRLPVFRGSRLSWLVACADHKIRMQLNRSNSAYDLDLWSWASPSLISVFNSLYLHIRITFLKFQLNRSNFAYDLDLWPWALPSSISVFNSPYPEDHFPQVSAQSEQFSIWPWPLTLGVALFDIGFQLTLSWGSLPPIQVSAQ